MSREIIDCLKRKQDVCIKTIIPRQYGLHVDPRLKEDISVHHHVLILLMVPGSTLETAFDKYKIQNVGRALIIKKKEKAVQQ